MNKKPAISCMLMISSLFCLIGCASTPPKNLCVSPAEDKYNIYFAFNSPAFDHKGTDTAKQLAQFASCCGKKITLNGYTDIKGSQVYNLKLAKRRVDAVKDLLISLGVPAESISVVPYGYANPVAEGNSDEVNALNRRVVAVLN